MKLPKNCKVELCVSDDKARWTLTAPYLDMADGYGKLVATNGKIMAVVPVETGEHDVDGWVSIDAIKSGRKLGTRLESEIEITCNGVCALKNGNSFPRPNQSDESCKFPNWRGVIPPCDRESAFSVTINPELLLDLARAIGSEKRITLKFGRDNGEVVSVIGDGNAYGVMTTMR